MKEIEIKAYAFWRATEGAERADVSFVPPLERRRLTELERAALSVAWQVKTAEALPVVFASRWGEIGVTAKLLKQFHDDGEMSPAGFSASVHNAAPGAFSLLTRNHESYTAIAARERSLEAGLLEAIAQRREVLFVYAEESTPALYRADFDGLQCAEACALRMGPGTGVDVEFSPREMAPCRLDDLRRFVTGETRELVTTSLTLRRG